MTPAESVSITFRPLTTARWRDFVELFGERGACGGCWCMWWALPRAEFERGKGEPNRRAMEARVHAGEAPGILAYEGRRPVGWCAVAPRERYPRLASSRLLAPVDARPVWSIVCFFVARGARRQGLSVRLLRAAVEHVKRRGGRIVEGYPVVPRGREVPAAFAWTGLLPAFERAGFAEVARRSPGRPIVRYSIAPSGSRGR
jgi:GNAT superfamily N-acetyltransferase